MNDATQTAILKIYTGTRYLRTYRQFNTISRAVPYLTRMVQYNYSSSPVLAVAGSGAPRTITNQHARNQTKISSAVQVKQSAHGQYGSTVLSVPQVDTSRHQMVTLLSNLFAESISANSLRQSMKGCVKPCERHETANGLFTTASTIETRDYERV